MQGVALDGLRAFLMGKDKWVLEEREEVTENSRRDGRICDFRRPENQPIKERLN